MMGNGDGSRIGIGFSKSKLWLEKIFLEKINVLLGFLFRCFLGFFSWISIIETDFFLRKAIIFDSSVIDCFRFREIDSDSCFIEEDVRIDSEIGKEFLKIKYL